MAVQQVSELRERQEVDVMPRVRVALVQWHLALVVKSREQPAPARAQRADVRRGDDHHAPQPEDATAFPHEVERPLQVLDPVDADDGVEGPIPERQGGVHVRRGEASGGKGEAVHHLPAAPRAPPRLPPPPKNTPPPRDVGQGAGGRPPPPQPPRPPPRRPPAGPPP